MIGKLDAFMGRNSEKLAEIKVGVKRVRDSDTVAQDLKVSTQPEMKRKKVESVETEKKVSDDFNHEYVFVQDEAKDESNPEDNQQANTAVIQGQ